MYVDLYTRRSNHERMIENLRNAIPGEEFDSLILKKALTGYRKPKDKVTKLIANGDIIRLRRGIYAFGKRWRRRPISIEIVANMLLGPSALSLEYALHFYGFIPEAVHEITSITPKKNWRYETPIGRFSYQHLAPRKFPVGLDWIQRGDGTSFYIATPEKAIADCLISRTPEIESPLALWDHLTESLRIEEAVIQNLDRHLIREIAEVYAKPVTQHLYNLVELRCR